MNSTLVEVLRSAARLQELVPDAVLVGGSAAAWHAGHRKSSDHDHVLADLSTRFDAVLEALEREPDWVTNRVTPGKIILGSLGDIEAGVRQMIRQRALEVEVASLPDGLTVRVPTVAETLRIKAFLIVRRNQVRDYLDVSAVSAHLGTEQASRVLSKIDEFYADSTKPGEAVATQLVRQLGNPRPRDLSSVAEIARYKGLQAPWNSWAAVRDQCRLLAAQMVIGSRAPEAGGGLMVRFRNIVGSPHDPVEEWGFEGLLAAVDRGDVGDWRRIMAAVRTDAYGPVVDVLLEVLEVAEDSGAAGALRTAVGMVRDEQATADRAAVAAELNRLVERSGLDQGAFARRIGTSRTRLNTYLTGRTMPSALVMLRACRITDRQAAT
ncbi:MAG: helix-turn-helix domain-containing protein [Microlunatus sp.]|nr:helix-turn-helix domain-containing protein [Microlunatus sp.]